MLTSAHTHQLNTEEQTMPSNVFKRVQADGSIVYGARRTVDGRQKPLGTFATREEAWEAVAIDKRGANTPENELLGRELSAKWIRQHVAGLSEATQRNYGRAQKLFDDRFGDQRVVTITRDELSSWALDQTEGNVRSIFSMFEWARTLELLSRPTNPLAGITGRPPATRHRYRVLTAHELGQLASAHDRLPALVAPAMRALVIVAGRSALRPGELFALRWKHIDFDKRQIHVAASVDVTGSEKPPKNGLERDVALTPDAEDALRALGQRSPEQYVFTLAHGSPFRKTSLAYWFEKMRERAGFPGYRFYDLRHTALTYLYVDLQLPSYVVAAQAGHQDNGRLIERRYGHPQHAQALAQILEASDRVTSEEAAEASEVTTGYREERRSA